MIISYLVGRRFLVGVMADRRLGSLENKIEENNKKQRLGAVPTRWCRSNQMGPRYSKSSRLSDLFTGEYRRFKVPDTGIYRE
jgi:hypothetical protein